jgi:hypothetical protein
MEFETFLKGAIVRDSIAKIPKSIRIIGWNLRDLFQNL